MRPFRDELDAPQALWRDDPGLHLQAVAACVVVPVDLRHTYGHVRRENCPKFSQKRLGDDSSSFITLLCNTMLLALPSSFFILQQQQQHNNLFSLPRATHFCRSAAWQKKKKYWTISGWGEVSLHQNQAQMYLQWIDRLTISEGNHGGSQEQDAELHLVGFLCLGWEGWAPHRPLSLYTRGTRLSIQPSCAPHIFGTEKKLASVSVSLLRVHVCEQKAAVMRQQVRGQARGPVEVKRRWRGRRPQRWVTHKQQQVRLADSQPPVWPSHVCNDQERNSNPLPQ